MYTVEHFPQYRHPFVVCRSDGSRAEGFNTRVLAEARAKELNVVPEFRSEFDALCPTE